ncbi:hypothetical protein KX928_09240 [Roseobacter sp. YSTF-M11]|uniref:Uncharacterized protein n=1 Tax=Roseobacter insulae TaxID=2859783 RepID=A0A9X1JYB0_9RHOB|nr:hypothetical protein [Roseobacter insulae]MBW4707970.1 hypothetical protein [Roseobacter insulae]
MTFGTSGRAICPVERRHLSLTGLGEFQVSGAQGIRDLLRRDAAIQIGTLAF